MEEEVEEEVVEEEEIAEGGGGRGGGKEEEPGVRISKTETSACLSSIEDFAGKEQVEVATGGRCVHQA